MTSTSRQSIATLATDLQDVLAWGAAAETANAAISAERDAAVSACDAMREMRDMERATVLQQVDTIAAKDAEIATLTTQRDNDRADITTLLNETLRLQLELTAAETEIARLTALLNPPPAFLAFDEMRAGDHSAYGFQNILVAYEGSTDWPNPLTNIAYFDNLFSNMKAANPNEPRIVIDYESPVLVSNGVVNQTVVQQYVAVVESAKRAGFTDVGIYGEIWERSTAHLTGTAAENVTRRASLFTRAAVMQPMWDAVTTIYGSGYFINPIHNNAAKRDQFFEDCAEMCAQFAPGKKVYVFLGPRYHISVDPNAPWIDGDYWRATLDKVHELFDGYALWLKAGQPDLSTYNPEPLWWTRTKEFQAQIGLVV
jgi:hypothetical protein